MARRTASAALLALALCCGICLSRADEYNVQFDAIFDGSVTSATGAMPFAKGDAADAVNFMKDNVVNGGWGGTLQMVDGFRNNSLAFFKERFGIVPDEVPADLGASIRVGADSYITPMLMDNAVGGNIQMFRNKNSIRYFSTATPLTEGGYYLTVGSSGLPQGGTYNKPLVAGSTVGFGGWSFKNVCPVLMQLCTHCCRNAGDGAGHSLGQLLINFQTDMPFAPITDKAWVAGGQGAGAVLRSVQMGTSVKAWGKGVCSGVQSALADAKTAGKYNLQGSVMCSFNAPSNYITN